MGVEVKREVVGLAFKIVLKICKKSFHKYQATKAEIKAIVIRAEPGIGGFWGAKSFLSLSFSLKIKKKDFEVIIGFTKIAKAWFLQK